MNQKLYYKVFANTGAQQSTAQQEYKVYINNIFKIS